MDATDCASTSSATNPPSVKISDNGFLLAPSRKAPSEAEQRQADGLQHTRHHQLPRRDHGRRAPQSLLSIHERGGEHRTAGHRRRQRVARVERGLRTPLPDVGRPPTSAACAGSERSCASTPAPRTRRPAPTTRSRTTGFATPWRAGPTPARPRRSSTRRRRRSAAQRTHQYLPRGRHSWMIPRSVRSCPPRQLPRSLRSRRGRRLRHGLQGNGAPPHRQRCQEPARRVVTLPGCLPGRQRPSRSSPLESRVTRSGGRRVGPSLVRKTAAWSWRLLIILGALVAVIWVVSHLEVIVVPVLLATMVTAMLLPLVDFLDRRD